MSWVEVGVAAPSVEWLTLPKALSSTLIRLSFYGDEAYLKKFRPRAYLRLNVLLEGTTQRWITLWPRNGAVEIINLSIVGIASNFIQLRKRRDPFSEQAPWTVLIEEFQQEPYLIDAETPLTIGGDPITIGGEPITIGGNPIDINE